MTQSSRQYASHCLKTVDLHVLLSHDAARLNGVKIDFILRTEMHIVYDSL